MFEQFKKVPTDIWIMFGAAIALFLLIWVAFARC